MAPQGRVSPPRHLADANQERTALSFHSPSLSARSLSVSLLSQGGDVVTYFKDFMQRALELETEDAATAASRLPSRPPHRTQHLPPEQARKLATRSCKLPLSTSPITTDLQLGRLGHRASAFPDRDANHRSGMHRARSSGAGPGSSVVMLCSQGVLHCLVLEPVGGRQAALQRGASRRRVEELYCRGYGITTVETIDLVVDKICTASTSLQEGVRSRRRARRRACGGVRRAPINRPGGLRLGARAKHLCDKPHKN